MSKVKFIERHIPAYYQYNVYADLSINLSENTGCVNGTMNALPNLVKYSSLTKTALVQEQHVGFERTNENLNEVSELLVLVISAYLFFCTLREAAMS